MAFLLGRKQQSTCKSYRKLRQFFRPHLERLEVRVVPALFGGGVFVAAGDATNDGHADILTGAGFGGGPHVKLYDSTNSSVIQNFFAYDSKFTGGVSVALGDVTGDNMLDVITGAGPGGGPHVRIFNGKTGADVGGFFAFNPTFAGGVHVATGDVDGDGRSDIIAAAGSGGGPHIVVRSGKDQSLIRSFFAYDPSFSGGVWVASGDVNGDGRADIITGAGKGGTSHVLVFSGKDSSILRSFVAFDPSFQGGVHVSSADLNGDGFADIVAGAGAGGGPHVVAIDGKTGSLLSSFFAYDRSFHGGVFVAAGDANHDGRLDIITGAGPGGGPHVRAVDYLTGATYESFMAYDDPLRRAYQVPLSDSMTVTGTFSFLGADADHNNEVGIIRVDDASGRVNGIRPGDAGYAFAALADSRHVPLYLNRQVVSKSVELPSGAFYAYYLIENSTIPTWRATNPNNQLGTVPRAYFSFPEANPDSFDHVHEMPGQVVAFEDYTGGGDRDFNDFIGQISFANVAPPTPRGGSVSGTVFLDTNENGKRDGVELPLPGVIVYLDANNNAKRDIGEVFVLSAGDGSYLLKSPADLVAHVRIELPIGFIMTTADAGEFKIFGGKSLANVNFGLNVPVTSVDFGDWTVAERGGTAGKRGTVDRNGTSATLREGDSFTTTLSRSFVIPANNSNLEFTLSKSAFDTSAKTLIRDAIEVAIIDADGKPLVPVISSGRDAYFNNTEFTGAVTGPGTSFNGTTVRVSLAGIPEGSEAIVVFRLVNNDSDTNSAVTISDLTLPGTPSNQTSRQFFVVDAGNATTFKYGSEGLDSGNFALGTGASPRGVASNVAGDPVWVIDASRRISVFNASGQVLGSWLATDVVDPQGVTIHNGSAWIVDRGTKTVRQYIGGANLRSGQRSANVSFSLIAGNSNPSDLVTDGSTIWVTDDSVDRVFAYDTAGVPLGNWQLDADNVSPSGITRNPAGGTDLWVVDRATKRVYHYPSGANQRSGQLSAAGTFLLSTNNAVPEGIADPPLLVAPNFDISEWAVLTGHPSSLEIAPANRGFAEGLFVGATTGDYEEGGPDYIYRIVNGVVTTFATLEAEADPIVMSFSPDGSPFGNFIYVNSQNRDGGRPDDQGGTIQRVDHSGNVSDFSPIGLPELGEPRSVAFSRSANFGEFIYITNSTDAPASLIKLSPNGTTTSFLPVSSESLGSAAFGPGGSFGTDLYVATYKGSTGGVLRIDSAGTITPFSSVGDVLSIAFGQGGAFGNDLYAYLGDGTVVRIRSDGTSSQFAKFSAYKGGGTGFGADLFAFSDDGRTLFVAEYNEGKIYKITSLVGPPSIQLDPIPNDGVVFGEDFILSGQAHADTPLAQVAYVTVNGVPTEVLDANGRFATRVHVLPGQNGFEFVVHDTLDQTASATTSITRVDPTSGSIEFLQLADLTASFQPSYARTSFRQDGKTLFADFSVTNLGQYPASVPLYVAIKNISDPSVRVLNAAGTTPDGLPYYDFTGLVNGGKFLDPNAQTGQLTLTFSTPNRKRFSYDLVFLGVLNRPPTITSLPKIEAHPGKMYRYDVGATDPDGDTLSYVVVTGPAGMVTDKITGVITWVPSADQLGNHEVLLRVTDGRGGTAQQRFTITCTLAPPNRPPVFTSRPVVESTVGVKYKYDADAIDPDGDVLEFSLAPGMFPFGMTIDKSTGLISWLPNGKQLGQNSVTVRVSDGLADATQTYTLCVGTGSNRSPVIVSTPITRAIGLNTNTATASPYKSTYEYMVVNHDELPGFELPTFDASSFSTGQGGFGTIDPTSACPLTLTAVGTNWPILTDILLRKSYVLPPGATNFTIKGAIDNAITVYLNGTKIGSLSRNGCSMLDDFTVTAPDSLLVAGNNLLAVRAADYGGVAYVDLSVSVTVLSGSEPGSIENSLAYSYDVDVVDPDQDAVSFSLDVGPVGMSIDTNTGLVTWTPPIALVGQSFPVSISVVDGHGGFDTQSFLVDVVAGDGSISGVVWHDANANGTWESPSESGLSGWRAFDDANKNNRFDIGEPSAVSGTDGKYSIKALPSDVYNIRLEPQSGWTSTFPPTDVHSVVLAPGQAATNIDFGRRTVGVSENFAPAFNSSAQTTIIATNRYTYRSFVTDPDGDPITFDLPMAPSGMAVHPTLGVVVWDPNNDQVGTHTVVIRAQDDHGHSVLQSFVLTVTPANNAPLFTSQLADGSKLLVNAPFVFDFRASDADGGELTFSIDSPLTGMSIDNRTGRFAWTPTAGQTGSQSILVSVADGKGGESRQTVAVNVFGASPNNSPVFTSKSRTTTWLGADYVTRVSASDIDHDPLVITLTAGPVGVVFDSATATLRWPENSLLLGDFPVTLTVTDGRGGSDTLSFTLHVASKMVNGAPTVVSVPPELGNVGGDYAYDLRATDPDNDPVVWTFITAPRGMVIDSDTGSIRWVPQSDQQGGNSVVVLVTDVYGATATQSFDIFVTCVNQAPNITSRPPTIGYIDNAYIYPVRADDPEGDALTFSFVSTPPTGMTIDPATGVIRWTPTLNQVGENAIAIRVTDSAGNSATQSFKVLVTTETPNHPPVITSQPPVHATIPGVYSYHVIAKDNDADNIAYQLLTAPSGMVIDPGTGQISWQPTVPADETVIIEAADGKGGRALQSYVLSVRPNQPPTIAAIKTQSITLGTTFRYDVMAKDAETPFLNYSLTKSPVGMTIDGFGRITWSTGGLPRTEAVTVEVSDSVGASASTSFTIQLVPDSKAPFVFVAAIPNRVAIGNTVRILLSATDDVGVTATKLFQNASEVPLSPNREALVTLTTAGRVTFTGWALDAAGNIGKASVDVIAFDPTNVTGPAVTITQLKTMVSPTETKTFPNPMTEVSTVSYLTDVYGTIQDPTLESWDVRFARVDQVDFDNLNIDGPAWRTIAQGIGNQVNAKLATFDPTLLANAGYLIAVVAYNANGIGTVRAVQVDVIGNAKLGEFRLEFKDLTVPLMGIPIDVTRVYDSRQSSETRDFGFGWTLAGRDGQINETVPQGGDGFFNLGSAFRTGTRVFITRPDGERVSFTFQPQAYCVDLGPFIGCVNFFPTYLPAFKADPGVTDTLEVDPAGIIQRSDGGWYYFIFNFNYNPDTYRLTTKEGLTYHYDQFSGLQKISDKNGNVVTFDDNGIHHSAGGQVIFTRDGQNRITKAQLQADAKSTPTTLLNYGYDSKGDLIRVDQIADAATTLTTKISYLAPTAKGYRPHYLDMIDDPNMSSSGLPSTKVEYDPVTGRVSKVYDGKGNWVEQSFDPSAFTGTIKDRNGNGTTYTYNERGNVVKVVDPEGGIKTFSYADPLNPDKETTIIQKVTQYKDGKAIGVADMVTELKYDARGNKTYTKTPGGAETATIYNALNKVVSITDPRNHTTNYGYDGTGNLTTVTNADGWVSVLGYDPMMPGRVMTFGDFAGNMTTFEYDDSSGMSHSPSKALYPDGSVATFKYNQYGQLTERIDGIGADMRSAHYKYDNLGRLLEQQLGDDAATQYFYTGDRLTKVLAPDVTGALTVETNYEYDDAGNRTWIKTNDGTSPVWTKFDYDKNGNLIALYDPLTAEQFRPGGQLVVGYEHPTRFEYTKTNLQKLEIDPIIEAGTDRVRTSKYDEAGNRVEFIDRNNRRRTFEYDADGHLLRELWWDGATIIRTIVQTYDKAGNLLSASDPDAILGYIYDSQNRILTATTSYPDTAVQNFTLTYGYDKNGNTTLITDGTGVTVASKYDAMNRLDIRQWYGGGIEPVSVDYHYNTAGDRDQLERFTDLAETNSAGKSLYEYDAAGRTSRIEHDFANGTPIVIYDYVYGKNGLLTHESHHGYSVDYQYDKTGQLLGADYTTITAGAFTPPDEFYRYDINGNRTKSGVSIAVPATSMTYSRGQNNRLGTTDSATDGKFKYQYDFEGNLTTKTKLDAQGNPTGEVTTFTYDYRNRLVRVDKSSPGGVITESYEYDPQGRRITIVGTQGMQFTILERAFAWADINSLGTVMNQYLFGAGIDAVLAKASSTTSGTIFVSDRLGSVCDLLSLDGANLTNTRRYAAFGALIAETSATTDRWGFTGRELNRTSDSYYYRARYYLPNQGRFQNEDPISFAAGDTNVFRYISNNPVRGTDPSGQSEFIEGRALAFIRVVASSALGGLIGAQAGAFIGIACLGLNNPNEEFSFERFQSIVGRATEYGVAVGFGLGVSLSTGGYTQRLLELSLAGFLAGTLYAELAHFDDCLR